MIARATAALRGGTAGRVRGLLRAALRGFLDDNCLQFAAAMSYYALFALFPLALLLVSAFGLFVSDAEARQTVVDFVLENLPLRADRGRPELERLLTTVTEQAGAFGAIGLAGLVVSASGLMAAIRAALNLAWDVTSSRPFLRGKAVDVLLVGGLGMLVALSTTLSLTQQLVASVADGLTGALGPLGSGIGIVLFLLGRIIPILIAFVAFAVLYWLVPATDVRLRTVWPAALAAAVATEVAKAGFGVYLGSFARYGAVYGSLATVVSFLIFVFIVANIFLFGAELAAKRGRGFTTPEAGRSEA